MQKNDVKSPEELSALMEWSRAGFDAEKVPPVYLERINYEAGNIVSNMKWIVFGWIGVVIACSYYFRWTGFICSLFAWVVFSAISSYIGMKKIVKSVGLPYHLISRVRVHYKI